MRQDIVFKALFAGIAVAVVPAAVMFYLSLGPMLWVATGALVTGMGLVVAAVADDDGDNQNDHGDTVEQTNCPDCGSRVAAANAECTYCEASLDG